MKLYVGTKPTDEGLKDRLRSERKGEQSVDDKTIHNKAVVMCRARLERSKRCVASIDAMIQDVAANGGEYSFTTVKGKVKDVHRIEPRLASAEHEDPQGGGDG